MSTYLAIDTATEACSVALLVNGEIHERFEVVQREHTQKLLPMIQALMAESGKSFAQLDGIACGVGPGSFAGVRIGVGVVKGLALARDLPVVGVSSLAMLAQRAMRLEKVAAVAAAIDARMNEIYFGAYRRSADGHPEAIIAERVCAAGRAPRLDAGPWLAAGTGWAPYEAALRSALGVLLEKIDSTALPHAEDALHLALPEFVAGRAIYSDALAPAYLRDNVALTLAEQATLRAR
ncbi:MAG: tRNA (adenosine(37)-N6)-threonylcarbamoyltransferase complex dimerization subunit type 1 TsaB [Hydrocarboniphaga effusa]|nr:tRNA (adenosine(37)-N6)-threonylcarbamoyltransferase complex dimerization subunit type 1 TsaB [Hydrocarboniphaga effusa]